ncbi:cytochrome c3 family protein [bacterium]|nr:cytochrome c3 family protein [bacterium]
MTRLPHTRSAWLAGLVMSLSVLLVACAPTTRYRVLSFFFDGVPVPEGVENGRPGDMEYASTSLTPFEVSMRAMREQRGPIESPQPVFLSIHQPVAENKCIQCHDPRQSFEEMPRDASLCDRCHEDQRREEGWDHGPINIGTCVPCHNPHQSQYEHLLQEPIPDLCLYCHRADLADDEEYHDVPNLDDCTACHDPHRMY